MFNMFHGLSVVLPANSFSRTTTLFQYKQSSIHTRHKLVNSAAKEVSFLIPSELLAIVTPNANSHL